MRVQLLAIAVLLAAQAASAQGSFTVQGSASSARPLAPPAHRPASLPWVATFGGPGSEIPWSTVQTRNGTFLVAGQTFTTDPTTGDGWVLGLSPLGAVRRQFALGGAGADEFKAVLATADGGGLLAGTTSSFGAGGTEGWLVKLGPTGAVQWQQTYGGADDEQFTALAASPNGFYVAGTVRKSPADVDAWMLEVGPNGGVLWQQTMGGKRDDVPAAIAPTPDGLALAINSSSEFGIGVVAFVRPWLVKLDLGGSVMWQKTYDISSGDLWADLIPLEEGGFVATGEALSAAFFRGDLWVVRLDDSGNIVWDRRLGDNFGTPWVDGGRQVHRTADGGFLVAGMTGTATPFDDVWLVKLSSDGGHEWNRALGGAASEYGHAMTPARGGGWLVAGFRPGIGEALVLRLTASGGTGSACGEVGPTDPNIWSSALTIGSPKASPVATSIAPAPSSAEPTGIKDTGGYVCSPP